MHRIIFVVGFQGTLLLIWCSCKESPLLPLVSSKLQIPPKIYINPIHTVNHDRKWTVGVIRQYKHFACWTVTCPFIYFIYASNYFCDRPTKLYAFPDFNMVLVARNVIIALSIFKTPETFENVYKPQSQLVLYGRISIFLFTFCMPVTCPYIDFIYASNYVCGRPSRTVAFDARGKNLHHRHQYLRNSRYLRKCSIIHAVRQRCYA